MIALTILAILALTVLAVARDQAETTSPRPSMPMRQRLALWLWPEVGAESEHSLDLAVDAIAGLGAELATARARAEALEQLLRSTAPSGGPYRASGRPAAHLTDGELLDAYVNGSSTAAYYNAGHLAGLRSVARAATAVAGPADAPRWRPS